MCVDFCFFFYVCRLYCPFWHFRWIHFFIVFNNDIITCTSNITFVLLGVRTMGFVCESFLTDYLVLLMQLCQIRLMVWWFQPSALNGFKVENKCFSGTFCFRFVWQNHLRSTVITRVGDIIFLDKRNLSLASHINHVSRFSSILVQ